MQHFLTVLASAVVSVSLQGFASEPRPNNLARLQSADAGNAQVTPRKLVPISDPKAVRNFSVSSILGTCFNRLTSATGEVPPFKEINGVRHYKASDIIALLRVGNDVAIRENVPGRAVVDGDWDFGPLLVPLHESGLEPRIFEEQERRGFAPPKYVVMVRGRLVLRNVSITGFFNQPQESAIWFQQGADFNGSTFEKDLRLSNAIFECASFNFVKFSGKAWFWESHFNRGGWFWFAKFDSASFSYVSFGVEPPLDSAGFVEAEFQGPADFTNTKFKGTAGFRSAKFGEANFSGAEFNGLAIFNSSVFRGDAGFRGTQFGGHSDLSFAQFRNSWYVADAVFHSLDLGGATWQNLAGVTWQQLGEALMAHHLALQGPDKETARQNLVTLLAKLQETLRSLGRTDDERACYRQRMRLERQGKPWYKAWPERVLFDWTCGYFTQVWKVLSWIAFIVVASSIWLTWLSLRVDGTIRVRLNSNQNMKLRTWNRLTRKFSPNEAWKIAVRQNLRYATSISLLNISLLLLLLLPLSDLIGRFQLNRRAKRIVKAERFLGTLLIGLLTYMLLNRLF